MPYNSLISRTDADALIPESVSRTIIQNVPEQSSVLRLARRLPNMTTKQRRMPVLSILPTAYFVDGDSGLKQTTEVNWANKYLNAEELACIVPIPEAVLDDADYPIWSEVHPLIEEAIGVTIDAAILHGINAPSAWPTDIATGAAGAGNSVDLSVIMATGDLYDALMGENGTIAKVEVDGFMVSGHIAAMTMRSKLRGLRADDGGGSCTGHPLFVRSMQQKNVYELDGEPIIFPKNGAVDPTAVLQFSGDWNQLVYSIRQDVTYKILTEAVIQDSAGNIIYNLAQQDMVALRVVMRLAWQLPNPINRLQETEADRYPFGILVP